MLWFDTAKCQAHEIPLGIGKDKPTAISKFILSPAAYLDSALLCTVIPALLPLITQYLPADTILQPSSFLTDFTTNTFLTSYTNYFVPRHAEELWVFTDSSLSCVFFITTWKHMAQFQGSNWQYLQVLLRGSIVCVTSDNLIVFYLRLKSTSDVNRWQQIFFGEKTNQPSNSISFRELSCHSLR